MNSSMSLIENHYILLIQVKVITNVLIVTNIKKNLLWIGQLTSNNPCKIVSISNEFFCPEFPGKNDS